MQIVTLITDWKNDVLYLSQIKGKLLSVSSNLNIIDLISNVMSFDIVDAAFIFRKSAINFPEGTIHLNLIDNQRVDNKDFVIIKSKNQYFVSRDNGFLSLVLPYEVDEIYKFTSVIHSFEELNSVTIIVDAIINNKLSEISKKVSDYHRTIVMTPSISEFQIIAHIVYIDSYGNLITDVTMKNFHQFTKDTSFKIFIKTDNNVIDKLSNHYSDVGHGDLVAIFNSMGLLELAQRNGNIAEIFDVKKYSEVRIEKFDDEKDKEPGTLF